MVENRRPRGAFEGLSAPSLPTTVVALLALLLFMATPTLAAAKRGIRFTGRKAKVPANMTDYTWHTRAHVVSLFPFYNSSSPLAYGGTSASFHGQEEFRSGEVEEMVAFAQQQGLFAVPPALEECTFDSYSEESEQGAAAAAAAASPPPVVLLGARRLDCEIAIDGPMCEQLVMEAVVYGPDVEPQKLWYRPSTGSIYHVELQQDKPSRRHHVTVSRDSHQHLSILQHTHFDPSDLSAPSTKKEFPSISCLSYNMWHNQPAAWVYPDASTRWSKYWERLAYLASIIWASGADVVGLQEVRYDQTFGPAGYHSGLSHLLDLLGALAVGEENKGKEGGSQGQSAPYQYVYQPAMSFAGHQGHVLREEEGVAILSRFPVRRTDYLLLRRDFSDPQDGHQRIVLHAQVEPLPGGPFVDVYVTHFSLSSPARDAAAGSIVAWAAEQGHEHVVLMGDLNAEPEEESLRVLHEGGFYDAWDEMHPFVPTPAEVCEVDNQNELKEEEGKKEDETYKRREGLAGATEKDACVRSVRGREKKVQERLAKASFTFPTCDPVKRIDYVLFRSKSLRPIGARLHGAGPTEESKDSDSPGGGMLERNGPVFASDHVAVLVKFVLMGT